VWPGSPTTPSPERRPPGFLPCGSSGGESSSAPPPPRRVGDWPQLLIGLARQLDDGRVYDRDLPDLSVALTAVVDAYGRLPYVRRQAAGDQRPL
jgi:hypothetical protein